MTNAIYCLDTSGFLDGYSRNYPPDIFESLWDRVEGLASEGRLLVPEEVYAELGHHHDAAYAWMKERKDALVVPTDAGIAMKVRGVLAASPRLVMEGSTRNRADPFVVATAELRGSAVVTGERGGTERSPKIPSVCRDRGIPCMTFLEMVQVEGWSF